MSTLTIEAPTPALRPARRVQARRQVARSLPAMTLPETVPTWLLPEHHDDPHFIALSRMSNRAIGMAMLASGADLNAIRKSGAYTNSIEDFITLAMAGLDAIGKAGACSAAIRYELALAEGRTSASGSFKGLNSPSPLLDEMIGSGKHRYVRAWVFWTAISVCDHGFLHDVHLWPSDRAWPYTRCGVRGICRHCYPEAFAAKAEA